VSLVAAALALDLLGETFNAISFAGLAVAVVVVIDEAVVSTENVARRLRHQRVNHDVRAAAAPVVDATHEMRSPLAYASLIALLAVAPVVVMEGRPGEFFEPLAFAYVLPVGAAMLVALTLAPALSLMLFSRRPLAGRVSPLLRAALPRYTALVGRFIRGPPPVLITVGLVAVAGLAAIPLLHTSPVPSFSDRNVLVQLDAQPGTSNPEMARIAGSLGREVRVLRGVDDVVAHVGRAKAGDQVVNVSSAQLWVGLDPGADHDKTLASIEDVVGRTRGVEHEVATDTTKRISEVGALREGDNVVTGDGLDLLTGSGRPLVVRVYGEEPAILRHQAERVLHVLLGVDGVVDPRLELPATQPTIEIETDLVRAQRFGVKPGDVRRAEAALLQGIHVGSIFEEQKVFDVVVQGVPATRRGVASVRDLLLDRPDGGHVRLGRVADVRVTRSPVSIERDAVSRRIDIEAGVGGRSLASVADEIEGRLARIAFPLEYHAEVLARTAADEVDAARMLVVAVAAAIAAFLLLQAAFQSWRLASLMFATLPLALVGGLVAAVLDGGELSLGAMLGLLALLGLAVRTGVVQIRNIQALELDGARFGPELVLRGARERFAPILTSTAATALVMLPCAIAGRAAGLEIVHPMALVVLGGLVTCALISLFVLPALYLRFGGRPVVLSPEEELLRQWAGASPSDRAVQRESVT
jgi:Cu/Ag efflux pump CusA